MTEIKRQSFIDYVKGKKLRWFNWDSRYHNFIPDGTFEGNTFYGKSAYDDSISWDIVIGLDERKGWRVVT